MAFRAKPELLKCPEIDREVLPNCSLKSRIYSGAEKAGALCGLRKDHLAKSQALVSGST